MIRKNHQLDISSKYEDRWKKQNKDIYDCIMINNTPITTPKKTYKIDFDKDFYKYFKDFYNNFERECIREKNSFVHFESIYKISDTEGVIKVTFGSYNQSEHKYILFKDKNVKYFPSNPIPIKENLDGHKLLIKTIKDKVNDARTKPCS